MEEIETYLQKLADDMLTLSSRLEDCNNVICNKSGTGALRAKAAAEYESYNGYLRALEIVHRDLSAINANCKALARQSMVWGGG